MKKQLLIAAVAASMTSVAKLCNHLNI